MVPNKAGRGSPTMLELLMVYGWALLMVSIFSFAALFLIMVPYLNHVNSPSSSITTSQGGIPASGLVP